MFYGEQLAIHGLAGLISLTNLSSPELSVDLPPPVVDSPADENKVSENEQLMVLANTNVDFPDIFGDVCGIKTTFTMRIRPFNVLCFIRN